MLFVVLKSDNYSITVAQVVRSYEVIDLTK